MGPQPPLRVLPDLIAAVLTGTGHPLGTRSIRRRVNRLLAELHDGVGSPWQVTGDTLTDTLDRERGRRFLRIDEFTWRLLEDEVAEMGSVGPPWDDRSSAQATLEALAQTTVGRRAVLRDAVPMLGQAVREMEPLVARTVGTVARQVDERTAERRSDMARLLGRALVELAASPRGGANGHAHGASPSPRGEPGEQPFPPPALTSPPPAARPWGRGSQHLPPLVPDPAPGTARSRFDATACVVLYNDRHPDYRLVEHDEAARLDYLATLAAKEYALDNHPGASGDDVAEEMVRVLVCMRHHLSSRRPGERPGARADCSVTPPS